MINSIWFFSEQCHFLFQCKRLIIQDAPIIMEYIKKFLEKRDFCNSIHVCGGKTVHAGAQVLGSLSSAWSPENYSEHIGSRSRYWCTCKQNFRHGVNSGQQRLYRIGYVHVKGKQIFCVKIQTPRDSCATCIVHGSWAAVCLKLQIIVLQRSYCFLYM